ncbi:MAG: 16S rRNA (uracil(1498)-N(3))-methyltransferase [Spirochaetes bacterium]|nr:16S rRNA (uracil(1498)-N(3))-methyltransferase [Spirochaetota bacterium]
MKQFILPDFDNSNNEIVLDKKETHYLKNVLRYKVGEIFTAADRSGNIWEAKILRFENRNSAITLCGKRELRPEAAEATKALPELVLYQCLLKGKKMDIVARQAAEAGVAAIVPVESEFAVAKAADGLKEKIARLEKICKEALQQSGSSVLTCIKPHIAFMQLARVCKKTETTVFFHQNSIENKSLHQYLFSDAERINIIVGPEGGFSDKEVKFMMENGFLPAFLGKNILRAETAAIYGIAAIKTILLEKEKWILC